MSPLANLPPLPAATGEPTTSVASGTADSNGDGGAFDKLVANSGSNTNASASNSTVADAKSATGPQSPGHSDGSSNDSTPIPAPNAAVPQPVSGELTAVNVALLLVASHLVPSGEAGTPAVTPGSATRAGDAASSVAGASARSFLDLSSKQSPTDKNITVPTTAVPLIDREQQASLKSSSDPAMAPGQAETTRTSFHSHVVSDTAAESVRPGDTSIGHTPEKDAVGSPAHPEDRTLDSGRALSSQGPGAPDDSLHSKETKASATHDPVVQDRSVASEGRGATTPAGVTTSHRAGQEPSQLGEHAVAGVGGVSAAASASTARALGQPTPAPRDLPGVASQLLTVVAAPRATPSGGQTVTVSLHPAELGDVRVSMTIADGQATVRLLAATPAGLEAIRSSLGELQSQLSSNGQQAQVSVEGGFAGAEQGSTGNPDGRDPERAAASNPSQIATGAAAIGTEATPSTTSDPNRLIDMRL